MTMNRWTSDEVDVLIEHYPKTVRKELQALLPNRKWCSIQQKSETMGIRRAAERRLWTGDEIAILKVRYPTGERVDELARSLGHSPSAIKTIAARLGLWRERRQIPANAARRKFSGEKLLAHLTEAERGYIAGLFDGEGSVSVGICKRKDRPGRDYRIVVAIGNTDPRVIEWLCHNIRDSALYISKPKLPNRRTFYLWRLRSGAAAVQFCAEIFPYLIIKREEAALVAEQLSAGFAPLSIEQREDLWRRLHTLKTKGPPQSPAA